MINARCLSEWLTFAIRTESLFSAVDVRRGNLCSHRAGGLGGIFDAGYGAVDCVVLCSSKDITLSVRVGLKP